MTAVVLRADARSLPLPDASVDLIVTSPPYFGLRSYSDGGEHYAGQIGAEETPAEYIAALIACTREWMRVLKPAGSLFVNLGDRYAVGDLLPKSLLNLPARYAIGCTDQLSLIQRAEVIWGKPSAMPESVTDRVQRSHEQVFHFVKQERYFAAMDEIRVPYQPSTLSRNKYARRVHAPGGYTDVSRGVLRDERPADHRANPLGKLPGSVWEIAPVPLAVPAYLDVDHFAAYPPELCHRIISGWSPPDAVVVDPFGGTGTTSLVADALGRTGYSFDLSADYCRLARWRTTDPGERARALGVAKPPPVPEGQASLFDGLAS